MGAVLLAALLAATPSAFELEEEVAEAATSSGMTTFVGLIVGGLGTPMVLGVVSIATGARASNDDLVNSAVIGGTVGAAAGGALGAWPTTTTWGPLAVGGAAGAGALIGLVPAAYFGKTVYFGNANETITLAHSGSLALAIAASSAAAAITGGLMAAPP